MKDEDHGIEEPGVRLDRIFTSDGLQAAYESLARCIEAHERFLVVAHVQPDGDAMGSTLAMCHLLWALGKEAQPFNVDPPPFNFTFLPGAEKLRCTLPEDVHYDVTIILDCAQPSRIGESFPAQGWGDTVVVLDHHKTWDPDFASLYVRDTTASAVGEMVYRLALTVGWEPSLDFAHCCYASIVADTGGSRYNKTSATTFQIASHLVERGVHPWYINSNIYESEPLERIRLLSKILDTLTLSACGRLAFLCIPQHLLDENNVTSDMLDGFINYARRVRGVEVATQMRELSPGHYKISFRSRGSVDVSVLAEAFGGGGHHNAAGCNIQGEAQHIQEQLAQQLSTMLG